MATVPAAITHRVFVIDGEVVIEDLGSRNGTYVNRKLIRGNRQTTLKFGDVITIGNYRLKLVEGSGDTGDAQSNDLQQLMNRWHGAAVTALTPSMRWCAEDAAGAVRDVAPATLRSCADAFTSSSERPTSAPAQIDVQFVPTPQGRRFERKLPRRPKVLSRRLAIKRLSALPVRSRLGSGASGRMRAR